MSHNPDDVIRRCAAAESSDRLKQSRSLRLPWQSLPVITADLFDELPPELSFRVFVFEFGFQLSLAVFIARVLHAVSPKKEGRSLHPRESINAEQERPGNEIRTGCRQEDCRQILPTQQEPQQPLLVPQP